MKNSEVNWECSLLQLLGNLQKFTKNIKNIEVFDNIFSFQ